VIWHGYTSHNKPIPLITSLMRVICCQGLGAPVGSILAGPRDFISRALRCRKALGGGMRQVGILAAAGRLALTEMVDRLVDDHRNAKTFAQGGWARVNVFPWWCMRCCKFLILDSRFKKLNGMKKWRCPAECAKEQYNTNNMNWRDQNSHNIYSIYSKSSSRDEK